MATNFFERQDAARRKTTLLIAYFSLCVVAIIAGVYCVALGVLAAYRTQQSIERIGEDPTVAGELAWWNPEIFLWASVGTVAVILLGSLYKTASLRHGGTTVAELLGGRQIPPETDNPNERRLINVVEEMAIASGTPVPPVYVLEGETGINAFAAGWSPGDAVVAVTRGTLEHLDRDELQGVVAHEFSHILNSDMRLNIRLIGIVHGILVIALIGYALLYAGAGRRRMYFSSRRDGGGRLLVVLVGLALIVIGYVGVFFGRLIKSAVSRQREFLADASAVQFTRNPSGIAGALKKIGGLFRGSRVANSHAEEASHMFFGSGVRSWFALLSTHPPLEERIRRLEPEFDGRFPKVETQPRVIAHPEEQHRPRPAAAPVFPAGAAGTGADELRRPLDPLRAVLQVGAPGVEHLAFAALLLEELPDLLHEAAKNPFGARAVIYALLLDSEEDVRESQLKHLAEHADEAVYGETRKLSTLVDGLRTEARLPLVDMTFPALRSLSEDQYRSFRSNVDELVRADRKIQLFEYVLRTMLIRHLDDHFQRRRPTRVRYYALKPLLGECSVVLSALAHQGHESEERAQHAFAQASRLLESDEPSLSLLPRSQADLKSLHKALEKLRRASPGVKKRVVAACAASIATDGEVTVSEGELLRATADALDCPMPPLIPGQQLDVAAL